MVRLGLYAGAMAAALSLIVLTHSAYDVVHEALAQLHIEREGMVRQSLRDLEGVAGGDQALWGRLRRGLVLLCQAMRARGGFIALRDQRTGSYQVVAQLHALRLGSELPPSRVECEELSPGSNALSDIAWIAPAFEAERQVGVIGVRGPSARLEYSAADLDLLVEVADHVGTILALSSRAPLAAGGPAGEGQAASREAPGLDAITEKMLAAAAANLDPDFVKAVEDGLRHLSSFIDLGESALATYLLVAGSSPADRGKHLNLRLRTAMESLRPAVEKPLGTPAREWFAYLVLHEAYVVGTPNRVIMNRLYVSEGTFNRTRRTALRGLARELLHQGASGPAA
jgi:hypothetical protein